MQYNLLERLSSRNSIFDCIHELVLFVKYLWNLFIFTLIDDELEIGTLNVSWEFIYEKL